MTIQIIFQSIISRTNMRDAPDHPFRWTLKFNCVKLAIWARVVIEQDQLGPGRADLSWLICILLYTFVYFLYAFVYFLYAFVCFLYAFTFSSEQICSDENMLQISSELIWNLYHNPAPK